jgi:hypothetical protein
MFWSTQHDRRHRLPASPVTSAVIAPTLRDGFARQRGAASARPRIDYAA